MNNNIEVVFNFNDYIVFLINNEYNHRLANDYYTSHYRYDNKRTCIFIDFYRTVKFYTL